MSFSIHFRFAFIGFFFSHSPPAHFQPNSCMLFYRRFWQFNPPGCLSNSITMLIHQCCFDLNKRTIHRHTHIRLLSISYHLCLFTYLILINWNLINHFLFIYLFIYRRIGIEDYTLFYTTNGWCNQFHTSNIGLCL